MIFRSTCAALFLATALLGVTRTVKTSGGDFTTLSGCSGASSAGDICEVYVGTYGGWTQSANGSSGSPITFKAHTGDSVTLNSTITVSSRSYITISGFSNITATILGNGSTQHIIIEDNHFTTTNAFRIPDGLGSGGSNNIFRRNTIDMNTAGGASTSPAMYVYGDSNLFDGNEIYNGSGDCFEGGGSFVVVRNNTCHDMDSTTSHEHLDFWQTIGGGTTPTTAFSLFEGNWFYNCTDPTGQCHLGIHRQGGGTGDTIIWRFNFAYNISGSGVGYGGSGDNAPNGCFIFNTIATGTLDTTNGAMVSFQNATGGQVFNNISSNSTSGGTSPTVGVGAANGNIAYTTGYASTWNSPYSAESTYATLRNQNPLFVDLTLGPQIQSGSPAKDAAVRVTSVATADTSSGTSLILDNAHCFQPGWAGVSADLLIVGTSTTATVSSIDYATNTVTLTGSISRADGDAVTIKQATDGTRAVVNTTRDIGAYEYGTAAVCTITTTSLASATQNAAYSQTVAQTNCSASSWTISVGSLPTGLSLNSSTGAITGTPTGTGTSSFTVAYDTDTQALSITVNAASTGPATPGGGTKWGGGVKIGL